MPQTFYAAVIALLRAYGCTHVRNCGGSHEVWNSPLTNRNFTVHYTLRSRHTANAVLKQAGIPDQEKL